jgi:hypothetical protein
MNRKKKIVAGIVIVLVAVVAVTVVVLVVTRTPRPNVVGTYVGLKGAEEITLAKDGTFTEIPVSFDLSGPPTLHYWVSGNNITIGTPKGPPTYKIEGNNRLVVDGTVWVKQLVKPNRPSSLVGTYTSSNGESLALDKNGAAYDTQQSQYGGSARGGTWFAGKNVVTAIFLKKKMTYTIDGKNLVGQGKEFAKTSDRAIVPATL